MSVIVLATLCAAACLPSISAGAEVTYVGAIRSGLSAPTSLATSIDQVAALQPYSKQIVAFTPDGTRTGRIDITGDTRGLALLDASVYLFCDRDLKQVTAVDLNDGRQWVFLGNLNEPSDLVVVESSCYVLDVVSRRIIETDAQGNVTGRIDVSAAGATVIDAPTSLAYDRVRDAFHVFDQTQSRAHVFDRTGRQLGSYCSFGNAGGTITRGGDIACDADGYVYIVDRYQGRVAVFDSEWEFVVDVNARALSGEMLDVPTGIAVDAQGTVYVASTESNSVHVFFVDKTAVPEGALAAAPLFPSPAGTVAVGDVRLVARLASDPGNGNVLAADFQIVEAHAPDATIAEAIGIAADEVGVDDDGRLVGTATWRPEAELEPGAVYQWRTRARAESRVGPWSGLVTFTTRAATLKHDLEPNYPNPFNPQTTIAFTVPATDRATLEIFDLRGTVVWSKTFQNLTAGRHTAGWDGHDNKGNSVASGVYFFRFQTEGFQQTRKMVLVR
jgi:hypothetical protein